MVIYNVTAQMNWSIHEEWIDWLKNEHLPGIEASALFDRCQVVRLLEVNDDEGPTYAIQYYASNTEQINRYKRELLAEAQRKETARWGDKICSFSSLMEVIN